MNEREYRSDRSLGNDQSSPGPITEYEREMYGGGDPQYNDHGSQFSLEYALEQNAEFYRHFGGEIESVEDESSLVAEKPEVENLTPVEKLGEAVSRGAKALPAALGEEIKALFSPATLATMVGVFAVYIAAHATGVGQAVDIGMLIAGGIFFGLDAFTIFKDLAGFAGAINATTEEELDIAGEHLASAVAKIGVDALMTLLTSKVADEIGKGIDNVNQVDEVHAHSEGSNPPLEPEGAGGNTEQPKLSEELDNVNQDVTEQPKLEIEGADNVSPGQVNDVDNLNNSSAIQNAGNTTPSLGNPAVANTLLPVLGREGVERLLKMDMFSFAPERMALLNSGYGQAVRNLPDLRNKPRVEIETILTNNGFELPKVGTTSGQEMWLHPDGSVVRMKLGPEALKDPRRPTEHLVREISRKQPASSKNRDIFAKVAEDGTLISAGPKFATDQLQQWFKKEVGRLPNDDETKALLRVWGDAAHIDFQP
jgi:hypothetical protein